MRKLALRWVAVAISVLVGLLLVEFGMRLQGIGSDQFVRPDRMLGVRFIPSKQGLNQAECFRARISINEFGWRSAPVAREKPDGVYRIVVLGDSYMAGLQVEDDETFSSLLQKRLNDGQPPLQVEVVNLGVPSFGTDQQYIALREFGLSLAPDLVLLAFYAQNDVGNNSVQIEGRGIAKTFFEIEGGELVGTPSPNRTPRVLRWVVRVGASFRLYPLLRDAVISNRFLHSSAHRLGLVAFPPRPGPPPDEAGRQERVWRWPQRWQQQLGAYWRKPSADWTHAWEITERLLLELRAESEQADAGFLLVGLPDPLAVMPAGMLEDLIPDGQIEGFDRDGPTRRLTELSREHGLDFVTLIPAFRERAGGSERAFDEYYLSCDGHWTTLGHQLGAEIIASEIADRVRRRRVHLTR